MNRAEDYSKKECPDGFVSIEDCKKLEFELDWMDEKFANVKLALDKIKMQIDSQSIISDCSKYDEGFIEGMIFSLNIVEAEMNKIIRRRK